MLLYDHPHLQWPSNDGLEIMKRKFEDVWGIPQVCGVFDCTHIEVELPIHTRSMDFYDKDHDYSYQ